MPAFHGPSGDIPLHSLFEPVREALRQHQAQKGAGALVFLGLGAGYHIQPFLADPLVSAVIVIEKDIATLRALMQAAALDALFSDPRVRLAVGPSQAGIAGMVLNLYVPVVSGDFRMIPLRPWCQRETGFFEGAAAEVVSAVERIRSDYSVQAHFGKKWFTNILLNLAVAEESALAIPPCTEAHVTAAGPSLDQSMERLRRRRGMLIAVDTSLPALLGNGIRPDLTVSIDCQLYSYHHFLHDVPSGMPLLLDLSSPPVLARRASPVGFFASDHPFCRYLAGGWRAFPRIDTSGGNVTHSAIVLADALGADTITLYGADYSYPSGRPYARGTYLFDYFCGLSSRMAPLETSFVSFIFRSDDVVKDLEAGTVRYTTPLLRGYRDSLVGLSTRLNARLRPVRGDGLPLPIGAGRTRSGAVKQPRTIREGLPFPAKASCPWRVFLADYARDISGLPSFSAPSGGFLASLSPVQQGLCATLFPAAACFQSQAEGGASGSMALEAARAWTLGQISRLLSA